MFVFRTFPGSARTKFVKTARPHMLNQMFTLFLFCSGFLNRFLMDFQRLFIVEVPGGQPWDALEAEG